MTPDTHAMWSSAVAEREAAREECRQLRLRVAGLEEETARLQGELRVRDENLDAARNRIAAYDEQFLASGPRITALESENSSLRTAVGLSETWTRQRDDAKRKIAVILGLAEGVTIGEILMAARRMAERVVALEAEVRVSDQRFAGQHDESTATLAALSAELDQTYTAGAALLADRAALAEHVSRRDLAIDALTRRVAEVMADCDRMQAIAAEVTIRLLDLINRHSLAARRVAAYARKLRIAERVL